MPPHSRGLNKVGSERMTGSSILLVGFLQEFSMRFLQARISKLAITARSFSDKSLADGAA